MMIWFVQMFAAMEVLIRWRSAEILVESKYTALGTVCSD
jgi:hypothetical protein